MKALPILFCLLMLNMPAQAADGDYRLAQQSQAGTMLADSQASRYQQTVDNYNKVIRDNPKDANAYHGRGKAYYDLKQYPQALADFNQALKLGLKTAELYTDRGQTYVDMEQYPQALADLNQAMKLAPKHVLAFQNRG
ncbi:MAG TPA: tetratricopeptide repeat protein, partial [Candidatus Obscuribacterales bacterium]